VGNYQVVYVPEGTVEDARSSTNAAFWAGAYEITNELYAAYLNGKPDRRSINERGESLIASNSRLFFSVGRWEIEPIYENHPVIAVTLAGAQAFCSNLSGRVPSGAEWLKLAVWNPATQSRQVFPWGNEIPSTDFVNFGSVYGTTSQVGIFSRGRSPIGAYDALGNVWEWTTDAQGINVLLRGGAWDSRLDQLAPEYVRVLNAQSALPNMGFRCIFDEQIIVHGE